MLVIRGLGRVLGDLAEVGFDAEWGVFSAADVGAPHIRERCWVRAHSRTISGGSRMLSDFSYCAKRRKAATFWGNDWKFNAHMGSVDPILASWRKAIPEPPIVRMADGIPYVLDSIKASGNAQLPAVA